jgi:hypothetical protein
MTGVAAIHGEAASEISRVGHAGDGAIHAAAAELQAAPLPFGGERHAKIDGFAFGIHGQDLTVHHAIAAVGVIHPARCAELDGTDRLADRGDGNGVTHALGRHVRSRDDFRTVGRRKQRAGRCNGLGAAGCGFSGRGGSSGYGRQRRGGEHEREGNLSEALGFPVRREGVRLGEGVGVFGLGRTFSEPTCNVRRGKNRTGQGDQAKQRKRPMQEQLPRGLRRDASFYGPWSTWGDNLNFDQTGVAYG